MKYFSLSPLVWTMYRIDTDICDFKFPRDQGCGVLSIVKFSKSLGSGTSQFMTNLKQKQSANNHFFPSHQLTPEHNIMFPSHQLIHFGFHGNKSIPPHNLLICVVIGSRWLGVLYYPWLCMFMYMSIFVHIFVRICVCVYMCTCTGVCMGIISLDHLTFVKGTYKCMCMYTRACKHIYIVYC